MEGEAEFEKFMRETFAAQNMDYDKILAKRNEIIDDLSRAGFIVREALRLLKETSSAIERYSKRCIDNTDLSAISFDD